jgi:hypothetical protein
MPLKLMLDTNCFDFIFNQGLLQKMVTARAEGKAEFYFTIVQRDEIEAFKDKDPAKYQYVQEVIEKVPIEEVYLHGAYLGIDEDTDTKRRYHGPRFGHMTFEEHDPLFDQLKSKLTDSHPLGDRGDLEIIRTAYYKKMDCIVTKNKEPFTSLVKQLQVERGSKLKVISHTDLPAFLQ